MGKQNRELAGKVVVITGAGRGIGLATALAFARHGASLTLVSRTESELAAAKVAAEHFNVSVLYIVADVTKSDAVRALFVNTLGHFGQIDILVNNVGSTLHAALQDITEEDWDRTLATNLRSTFLCTKAALPHFYNQRSGRIINVASTSGMRGYAHTAAYCAAKFGVRGFTQAVDAEARAFGVRAAVVCPGPTDTQLRRTGHPDEDPTANMRPENVADAILYLALQPTTSNIDELTIRPPV